MSRGLTDEPPVSKQEDNEIENVIRDIILGQNKLHDRLIDLERRLDHMDANNTEKKQPSTTYKPWLLGGRP